MKKEYLKLLFALAAIILFALAIYISPVKALKIETQKMVFSLVASLFAGIITGYINASFRTSFIIAASFAVVTGPAYGVICGIISVFLNYLTVRLKRGEAVFSSCPLQLYADEYVFSFSLAFLSTISIARYLSWNVFYLFFPVFIWMFLYLSSNIIMPFILRDPGEKFKIKAISNESVFELMHAPVASLIAFAVSENAFELVLLALLLLFVSAKSSGRSIEFSAPDAAEKTAQFVLEQIYGYKEIYNSFCSLIEAISRESSEKVDVEAAKKSFLLTSLAWTPFSATLFKKPDRLNAQEIMTLEKNIKKLYQASIKAGYSPEASDAIIKYYENYDGTGIPYGIEASDIPSSVRAARVIERYLILTEWNSLTTPVSDREAIAALKELSGSFFDPHFVGLLEKIILPQEKMIMEDTQEESSDKTDQTESGEASLGEVCEKAEEVDVEKTMEIETVEASLNQNSSESKEDMTADKTSDGDQKDA